MFCALFSVFAKSLQVLVSSTGEHVGSVSMLMSWSPPSCSGKCLRHGCSGTADLGQIGEMTQWIANGIRHKTKIAHLAALPKRPPAPNRSVA
jgi:hypothetical protein